MPVKSLHDTKLLGKYVLYKLSKGNYKFSLVLYLIFLLRKGKLLLLLLLYACLFFILDRREKIFLSLCYEKKLNRWYLVTWLSYEIWNIFLCCEKHIFPFISCPHCLQMKVSLRTKQNLACPVLCTVSWAVSVKLWRYQKKKKKVCACERYLPLKIKKESVFQNANCTPFI